MRTVLIYRLLFLFLTVHLCGTAYSQEIQDSVPVAADDKGLPAHISRLGQEDLAGATFLTIHETLQGRLSGVHMTQTSGQSVPAFAVRVRGIRSLAAGTQPLYVIDGFPVYSDNFAGSMGIAAGPRTELLGLLDPADIASVEVLKNAAGTAMYGARGANGVVLIKTKPGKPDEPGIMLNVFGGFQEPIDQYDLLGGADFANYVNEARTNAGLSPLYQNVAAIGTGTDWQNEIYRNSAALQNYKITFGGGSEMIRYMISGSYSDQQGVIRNSRVRRANLHANIEAKPNDKLTIRNALNLGRIELGSVITDDPGDERGSGALTGALMFNPALPVYNPAGDFNILNTTIDANGMPTSVLQTDFALINPVAQILLSQSELQNTRLLDHLSLQYTVLKDLTLEVSGGIDALVNEEQFFSSGELEPSLPLGGKGRAGKLQSLNWVNAYEIQYNWSPREGDALMAMGGFAMQGFIGERLSGTSLGFENETLGFYNLSVGQDQKINSRLFDWQLVSYYGQLRYSSRDRYHLTLTGRADGSSRFNGDYAFFPAVSFQWDISKESFFKRGTLSELTLDLGYGSSGNQEITPYSAFSILQQFETIVNGVNLKGFRPITLQNDNLEMERTSQFNIGIDFALFSDRLQGMLQFYRQNTENALIYLPVQGSSGFDFALQNGAEIRNCGIDLALTTHNIQGDLSWTSSFYFGTHNNEIKNIDKGLQIVTGTPLQGIDGWTLLAEGHSIGSFYGYQTDGIVQASDNLAAIPAFPGQSIQPGDRRYKDQNGDGIIDNLDRVVIGEAVPDVTLGLNNKISYQGFDLHFFFQGVFGNDIANMNKVAIESLDGHSNISTEAFADRWTPSHQGGSYPRAYYEQVPRRVFSDAYVESGTYFRLKNITLGYQLPSSLLDRYNIANIRVYVSGNNLITLTNYSGIDPDVSHFGQSPIEQGVDFGGYPKARQIIGGLSISF